MDDQELRRKWPELKQKLKEKYPHLTEEELMLEIGKEGELLERLQTKLGKNWHELKKVLALLG